MPDNPLLKLRLEQVRALTFGDSFVDYRIRKETFRITFTSREEMELAVKQWLEQAHRSGEFFRMDVIKGMLRWQRSQSRALRKASHCETA